MTRHIAAHKKQDGRWNEGSFPLWSRFWSHLRYILEDEGDLEEQFESLACDLSTFNYILTINKLYASFCFKPNIFQKLHTCVMAFKLAATIVLNLWNKIGI